MSPHFARLAKEVYGYKNVKYMVEGHGTWQGGINPYYTEPEFLKLAQDEGVSHILIDLRDEAVAKSGHIAGAVNFPLGDKPLAAMQKLNKALPAKQKKEARIIYYSDKPEEALTAHQIMRANDWENGYILNGGIQGWQAKGYPVVRDKLQSQIAYEWTPLPGAMFIPEYEEVVKKQPADTVIVDVRSPGEYMKSMVPGAITIPIDTLDKRFNELPKDKNIIIQCQAGNRALMGWRVLVNAGFDPKKVRWVDGHISKFSKGTMKEGAYGK